MKVAIIMGSTSDLEIMSQAINVLEGFGVEVVKKVISAHRTPDLMCEFAKSAKDNGIGVIIAGAGGAAHVAGVVAGMTTVPVIGVPIQTKALGGMDSLLSIVQMPAGIPVRMPDFSPRRFLPLQTRLLQQSLTSSERSRHRKFLKRQSKTI